MVGQPVRRGKRRPGDYLAPASCLLASVTLFDRFGHLALEEQFMLCGLGGAFGFQFGDFLLLLGGQFDDWRGFAQPFHREFIGALHSDKIFDNPA